jgi:arginine/ornithine N-succinyltransferase beta subunit
LKKVLRGRDLGCIGCRLICESLPLLNDYYTGSDEASGLFLHADSREGEEGNGEARWSLIFEEFGKDNVWRYIGEFEVCKITGKQDF